MNALTANNINTNPEVRVVTHSGNTVAIYPINFSVAGDVAMVSYDPATGTLVIDTFPQQYAPAAHKTVKIRPGMPHQGGLSANPYFSLSQTKTFGFRFAAKQSFDTAAHVVQNVGGGLKITVHIPMPNKAGAAAANSNLPIVTPTATVVTTANGQIADRVVELSKQDFIDAVSENAGKFIEFTINHYGQKTTFKLV